MTDRSDQAPGDPRVGYAQLYDHPGHAGVSILTSPPGQLNTQTFRVVVR